MLREYFRKYGIRMCTFTCMCIRKVTIKNDSFKGAPLTGSLETGLSGTRGEQAGSELYMYILGGDNKGLIIHVCFYCFCFVKRRRSLPSRSKCACVLAQNTGTSLRTKQKIIVLDLV